MQLKIHSPFHPAVVTKLQSDNLEKKPKKPHPWLLLFVIAVMIFFASKPFLEYDENGIPRLALWRKQKLEKELKDLEEAEQYVIVAALPGIYPCYSCIGSQTIYLHKGETWKYGVTTKGKSGRYGNSLEAMNLLYIVEFKGSIEQCLKEERRKIYQYAVLPENLARSVPLIRPPGNKKDS